MSVPAISSKTSLHANNSSTTTHIHESDQKTNAVAVESLASTIRKRKVEAPLSTSTTKRLETQCSASTASTSPMLDESEDHRMEGNAERESGSQTTTHTHTHKTDETTNAIATTSLKKPNLAPLSPFYKLGLDVTCLIRSYDASLTFATVDKLFRAAATAMPHFWNVNCEMFENYPGSAEFIDRLKTQHVGTWDGFPTGRKLELLNTAMKDELRRLDPDHFTSLKASERTLDPSFYTSMAEDIALIRVRGAFTSALANLDLNTLSLHDFRAFLNHPENQDRIRKIRILDFSPSNIRFFPEEIKKFTGVEFMKF